jgi:hypothetical protein
MITGSPLSVSAGVYIYIAATECIPRIQAVHKNATGHSDVLTSVLLLQSRIGLVLKPRSLRAREGAPLDQFGCRPSETFAYC